MRPQLRLLLPMLTVLWPGLAQNWPTPAFADAAQRTVRLRQAFPELEKLAADWVRSRGVPGMSYGVVIDGEAALIRTIGYRQWEEKKPVEAATPFRIASMTKSFTSLAILKLRDAGKLSLDDEVARWIPEVARFRYPTADSAPLRVRQLLTHGAGFPEDNPWGDQQLGRSDATLTGWLERGIPWSTAPDTAFEYSNYGFGLLGRIVEKASGRGYREYLESEILKPLGMSSSTLEPADAKEAAVGYRKENGPGGFRAEPSLPHGAFGAMGGLVTTAPDLARYVAFHLAAYPPRDEAEAGPVRRASVREMHRMWRFVNLQVRRGQPEASVTSRANSYGYGLSVSSDCRFNHIVGHGGGLPGFGSYMIWLPDYGVGLFAMTNLTYAGPAGLLSDMLEALGRTGALTPRGLAPSAELASAQQGLFALWNDWKQPDAGRLAADNLFLDRAAAERQAEIASLKRSVGQCRLDGPVRAENWLRGEFDLACERGSTIRMTFTLAPTAPSPTVQYWNLQAIQPLAPGLHKAAGQVARGKSPAAPFRQRVEAFARLYGACKVGSTLAGNGTTEGTVMLDCARARAELSLTADQRGRITALSIARPAADSCVP